MKKLLIFVFLIQFLQVSGQKQAKPPIDERAIDNWMSTSYLRSIVRISNDGEYFLYAYGNSTSTRLVVQSTRSSKRYEFIGATNAIFEPSSKQAIFLKQDTLCRLDLTKGSIDRLPGIESLQYPKNSESLLIYRLRNAARTLVAENLITKKIVKVDNVSTFSFDDEGNRAMLQVNNDLIYLDLKTGSMVRIFSVTEGRKVLSRIFAKRSSETAFTVVSQTGTTIWFYKPGMQYASEKINGDEIQKSSNLTIGNTTAIAYSDNGKYLFFQMERPKPTILPNQVGVDVWNFRDRNIQSSQLYYDYQKSFWYVYNVEENIVSALENEQSRLISSPLNVKSDYLIITGYNGDRFWQEPYYCDTCSQTDRLISLKNGSTKELPFKNGRREYYFSPNGKRLVCFRYLNKVSAYYSIAIETGAYTDISGNELKPIYTSDDGGNFERTNSSPVGIACWGDDDASVMVYDNFDIWKLFLNGKKEPVNFTNSYGMSHGVRMRIVDDVRDSYVKSSDKLLLAAFNSTNKTNGLYRKAMEHPGSPDSLVMKPWIIYMSTNQMVPQNDMITDKGMRPLKARYTNAWIVSLQSSIQAPNYYFTNDFKNYRQLTDMRPQEEYNWYRTELVAWKQADGRKIQGILYKPEDFDPLKKYPVIIYHYQQMSQRLNFYIKPELCSDLISIPWFVSRGYLVLAPDIYFTTTDGAGASANSAISSAVNWLSALSYVDRHRIGLDGHSRSGFTTNYIVANCNLFAAALASAGGADAITSSFGFGGLGERLGVSRLSSVEPSYGYTLWEKPEYYLEQSPILRADRVSTPLLLFHSKADNVVPFELSSQYFTALRRLQKPVWLLQYDKGRHGLGNVAEQRDYTIRVTQFFDHYLKGAPAPVWMTKGVPARLKGVDTGLELDIEGSKNLPSNPYLKN